MAANRRFALWSELLPEMRQEIRARMPKITQFILASTCKQERAVFNKNTIMKTTKKHPLLWQICQTIVADEESSFEWLIPQVRQMIMSNDITDPVNLHQLVRSWVYSMGIAIGKSGNLKWWIDDRLYNKLPSLNTMYPKNQSKRYRFTHSRGCNCINCYIPHIIRGLAKANHHDVFFELYKMANERDVRFRAEFPGGPIGHTFLEEAAYFGRHEWIIQLLANTTTPWGDTSGTIVGAAISGGQTHVLQWLHAKTPTWFQADSHLDRRILKNNHISIEKVIEMLAWLYNVVRYPPSRDFLLRIVRRYIKSPPHNNPWKLLEFARSMDLFAHDKTALPAVMRRQLSVLVDGMRRTLSRLGNYPDGGTVYDSLEFPVDPTPEDVLDWIDHKIEIEKGKAIQGH